MIESYTMNCINYETLFENNDGSIRCQRIVDITACLLVETM